MHGSQITGKNCFPQCFLNFISIPKLLVIFKSDMDGI